MQVYPSGNYIPAVKSSPKTYKPAFHSSHLSCNISYGSAATLWVFRLPQWGYSYSTQSSMIELPVSISTLKPPLGIIRVLLLKLQASPILSVYIRLVVTL